MKINDTGRLEVHSLSCPTSRNRSGLRKAVFREMAAVTEMAFLGCVIDAMTT